MKEDSKKSYRGRDRGSRSRLTEDELFLKAAVEQLEELPSVVAKGEAWRVFRIMGEFVEGFDELTRLGPAVSIFGSARTPPGDPSYKECKETARLLGEAGFGLRRQRPVLDLPWSYPVGVRSQAQQL